MYDEVEISGDELGQVGVGGDGPIATRADEFEPERAGGVEEFPGLRKPVEVGWSERNRFEIVGVGRCAGTDRQAEHAVCGIARCNGGEVGEELIRVGNPLRDAP